MRVGREMDRSMEGRRGNERREKRRRGYVRTYWKLKVRITEENRGKESGGKKNAGKEQKGQRRGEKRKGENWDLKEKGEEQREGEERRGEGGKKEKQNLTHTKI